MEQIGTVQRCAKSCAPFLVRSSGSSTCWRPMLFEKREEGAGCRRYASI
jgi:hypothetical protein